MARRIRVGTDPSMGRSKNVQLLVVSEEEQKDQQKHR